MESHSTRHIPLFISTFMTDGISSTSGDLCDQERRECLTRLLSPAIYQEMCSLYEFKHNPYISLFSEIGDKPHIRRHIRKYIRFLLSVNHIAGLLYKRKVKNDKHVRQWKSLSSKHSCNALNRQALKYTRTSFLWLLSPWWRPETVVSPDRCSFYPYNRKITTDRENDSQKIRLHQRSAALSTHS